MFSCACISSQQNAFIFLLLVKFNAFHGSEEKQVNLVIWGNWMFLSTILENRYCPTLYESVELMLAGYNCFCSKQKIIKYLFRIVETFASFLHAGTLILGQQAQSQHLAEPSTTYSSHGSLGIHYFIFFYFLHNEQ